jgi:hypothetical protein
MSGPGSISDAVAGRPYDPRVVCLMDDLEMLRALLSGLGTDGPTGEEYTAIPSRHTPRLLVPRRSRRVATAAIRHVIAPSSRRARLRQSALVGVFAVGLGDIVFRDTLRTSGAPTLAGHLSDALGIPVQLSVRCGPARANRKPVLQLLDQRGRTVAFVKVGVNALTRALVVAEAEVLRRIEGRDLGGVRAPRVLRTEPWNTVELLVLDALPVWGTHGRSIEAGAQVAAMRAVAGAATMRRLADSPYLDALAARVAALGDRPGVAVLAQTVRNARLTEAKLPFAAWHGDWNGGNTAVRDDQVLLWDWERYDSDVPLGFDMVHYELHEEVTVRGTDPGPASSAMVRRCASLLAPFGLDADQARVVTALYFAEIATRYLGDGQEQGSTRLGRAGEWIGEALGAAGDWWTQPQEVAPHGT